MNDMQVLNIQGIQCYEKDGTAYLKLDTVARGLGFTQEKNGYDYIRWDRVEQYLTEIGFPHKWGKDSFIPENIFYRLAMKAKNAVAEAFQAKVADEIIPAIRKTGGYIAGEKSMTDEELMAKALLMAQNKIQQRDERIKALEHSNTALEAKVEADAPKVLFADSVAASNQSILIGELAKILRQNGIEIGQNRLFERLRKEGYLGTHGEYYNIPTQRAMDLKLFEIKKRAINSPDGRNIVSTTVKVTGKGQQYFVNRYLGKFAAT